MKQIIDEMVATEKLLPYAKNAIQHKPAQVKSLAASIKSFGFTNPVLIDESGTIVGGHGRVMAAEMLGLETVPCRRFIGYSENEIKAYRLIDNRLAEVNRAWDTEMLQVELADLNFSDFDLSEDDLKFDTVFTNEDDDDEDILDPTESSTEELDPESYEFNHRCPKCGFEWDGDA